MHTLNTTIYKTSKISNLKKEASKSFQQSYAQQDNPSRHGHGHGQAPRVSRSSTSTSILSEQSTFHYKPNIDANQTKAANKRVSPPPFHSREKTENNSEKAEKLASEFSQASATNLLEKQGNKRKNKKTKFTCISSYVMNGIDSVKIDVEVSISVGLSKIEIIGLPDMAIRESRERILKSVLANGYKIPTGNITINLASAKIKKRGTLYDLPIALALLTASGQISSPANLQSFVIAGELSLEGDVRPVEGIFSTVLDHIQAKKKYLYIIPRENMKDFLSLQKIQKIDFFPVTSLQEAIQALQDQRPCKISPSSLLSDNETQKTPKQEDETALINETDFLEVAGNSVAKLAIQLAVIGKLNVLLVGVPGCGKSMLMKCVPSVLPKLTLEKALMVSRIYKSYGYDIDDLIQKMPFREVHSSIYVPSLIGGGSPPKPGEISLAHNGVLFLDELSEFSRIALQSLRTPVEKKTITISRVDHQSTFPCNFMLFACTNPCPCGYHGDGIKMCSCNRSMISRFYARLSGPLIDRFDIVIRVSRADEKDFVNGKSISSQTMRANIQKAFENRKTMKPFYYKKTLQQVFQENSLAKEVIINAMNKQFISFRKVRSIFRVAHALELFYGEAMNKKIILQSLELVRNKLHLN